MHGGVCTAGIDSDGKWVRPVRATPQRQWLRDVITDRCLLPIDFFHGGRPHLVNLGVTRCRLAAHSPEPPHTEDWTIDLSHKPQLIKKLSTDEQATFLAAHVEPGVSAFAADGERSLGLFQPKSFSFSFSLNQTGEDVNVRATFSIGGHEVSDAGCTDLRVR